MKTVISALSTKAINNNGRLSNKEDRRITTATIVQTAIRVIVLVFLQLLLVTLFFGIWLFLKSLAWQQETIIVTIVAMASLLVLIGLACRSPR